MVLTVLAKYLTELGACEDAIKWAGRRRSFSRAWRECERGDWLLWICAAIGLDRKLVVQAACACARLALVHVPDGEDRPRLAIEAAEAWCRGEAPLEQARVAGAAACAAYAAADAAADADYAAYAAAAYAAAYAAADAASDREIALAQCAAASAADAASDREIALAQCAAEVRRVIPWDVVEDALEATRPRPRRSNCEC